MVKHIATTYLLRAVALFLLIGFLITPSVTAMESTTAKHTADYTYVDPAGTFYAGETAVAESGDADADESQQGKMHKRTLTPEEFKRYLTEHQTLKISLDGQNPVNAFSFFEYRPDLIPQQVELLEADDGSGDAVLLPALDVCTITHTDYTTFMAILTIIVVITSIVLLILAWKSGINGYIIAVSILGLTLTFFAVMEYFIVD